LLKNIIFLYGLIHVDLQKMHILSGSLKKQDSLLMKSLKKFIVWQMDFILVIKKMGWLILVEECFLETKVYSIKNFLLLLVILEIELNKIRF